MSPKLKAALGSFGRSLAATTLAAYLQLGKQPLDLQLDDAKVLVNALIGAAILLAFNAVRPGETRFGRGAEDMGMGGEDVLERPEGRVQTPEGELPPFDPVATKRPPGSRASRVARLKDKGGDA